MKPVITGTFFDFQHHNVPEGVYWNPPTAEFTDEMWEAKVEEMAEIGMKYIAVMAVALKDKSFYPSKIYPMWPLKAKDPVGAVLKAADRTGVKVFLGAGFYGDWTKPHAAFVDPAIRERTRQAMAELVEKYGHHQSFYGFYWPNELGISGHFPQSFIDHCKECNAWAHEFMPRAKTMIAPYGTNNVTADERYVEQLKEMGVDIFAYQDEIGVRKSKIKDLDAYYKALKEVHDKAGVTLWADMEIFEFAGEVYVSALIPAEMERIKGQLAVISKYVEEIVCYQYLGMMNKPGSQASAGHPDAEKLYSDYVSYLKEVK